MCEALAAQRKKAYLLELRSFVVQRVLLVGFVPVNPFTFIKLCISCQCFSVLLSAFSVSGLMNNISNVGKVALQM